jgi:hypothetical protein
VSKDTHHTRTAEQPQLELPAAVTIAVAELASAARQGLLALAVGMGLQVLQVLQVLQAMQAMQAMLDEDVTRLVGAKGRHNPQRTAVRHSSEPGQVTLGGRRVRVRVRVRRPRVRATDGTGEVSVATIRRLPPPSCQTRWRWSGCWPSCRPAATQQGWNPSASKRRRPPRGSRSRRSPAGLFKPPSTP